MTKRIVNGYNYNDIISLKLDELNKKGYIDKQVLEKLFDLFNDNDYIIGIHRTGYTIINDNILKNIFNHGLYNNGHAMFGGILDSIDIKNTIDLYYDFTNLCVDIKFCNDYKKS